MRRKCNKNVKSTWNLAAACFPKIKKLVMYVSIKIKWEKLFKSLDLLLVKTAESLKYVMYNCLLL